MAEIEEKPRKSNIHAVGVPEKEKNRTEFIFKTPNKHCGNERIHTLERLSGYLGKINRKRAFLKLVKY